MLKTHKSKKFAFFYQDDSYGIGPLKAAHEELKKHNITTWVDTPYTRSEVNFQEQAEKIIKAQVDVIVFFAQVFPSQELIRQIGIETLANKKLCIISPINIAPMHNFIEEYGLEAIMSSVVPNPYTSNLQIVQDYRAAADAIKLPYDVYSLEAYIATKLLGQALRSIKPPFSNEKIMTYFESLKNYNFEGLPLNFNPETRTLLHKVWVGLGTKSSWVEEDIPSEKTGLW
jgi:ABC-type branched-subunit amino acid transport system substrate-binding protein